MLSRPAVALFAIVVIEYVVATQLAGLIGGQAVALTIIGLTVAGFVLFRRIGAAFIESSVASAVRKSGLEGLAGDRFVAAGADDGRTADRAMQLFGALLMIVPGIASGLVGLLFLLPPVRAVARPVVHHRIQPWIRPDLRFGRRTMGFGREVVDVDIVDDATDEPPSPRAELS